MKLLDYTRKNRKQYLIENYFIEHNKRKFILSYNHMTNQWYLDNLNNNCNVMKYDIKEFINYVEPKNYRLNHVMETTQEVVDKMIKDYDNNYQYLDNCCVFVTNGFFEPIICVDNYCECIVEEFTSITLSLLWLYKDYFTNGCDDLWFEE